MNDIKKQLAQALLEIERLKKENSTLRKQLDIFKQMDSPLETINNTSEQQKSNVNIHKPKDEEITIHQYSTPLEKITLFRSLFRGREDVFPARWQNKAGKSGYSPACGNEWTAVCMKPQVKCSDCMYQQFLPITDEVINKHLDAKFNQTLGVYPMLQDETCWFVAIDLDKHDWKTDAKAVMETCEEMGVPAALERSRSGQGGHIWIFFEEPIAATIARKLGFSIISKTMQSRYQLGLDSYDRLFPNQDTLPKGGFGNLIALPLQGVPRKQGNSVFVDNELMPFDDQWRFLSQMRKLSSDKVEKIVRDAAANGEVINAGFINIDEEDERPWDSVHKSSGSILQGTLPSSIEIVLSNMVYISKDGLPSNMINRLIGLAAFQNPDFYKTQAMRLPTYGKPRVIGCAEDFPKHIALPRGCLQPVLDLFNGHAVKPVLHDERNHGQPIEVGFVGTLSMLQDGAARGVMAQEIGILSATTAFGKTVVAANIIATRKVNTLVLVHRRELMDQWKERLKTFLEVHESDIGIVGGGKDKRTGKIDIAVIQSLNIKGQVKEYISDYGQIIVDECHHVSAYSYEQVLKMAKAKYVVGLTATLARQDGHHPIVLMQCGPIRIRIDAKSQASARGMEHKVIPRYTSFQLPKATGNLSIQDIYQLLIEDEERNSFIFDDILNCLDQGRSPVLLAERTAHVEYFEKRLEKFAKNVIVLRGGMGKKQREAVRQKIAGIKDHEERVFIATGKLIGEGFDDARLDTLFLVHPVSWKGTLQQYAGRLHRSHINKTEVQIYDYIDLQVPMLKSMYKKRIHGYRAMGYKGFEL